MPQSSHLRFILTVFGAALLGALLLNATRAGQVPVASAQAPKPLSAPAPVIQVLAQEINQFTKVPPPAQVMGLDRVQTATFQVTYSGFTPEAQAAFQYAVNIWASLVTSPVPIRVNADWTALGPGVLGQAGPGTLTANWGSQPVNNTWYPIAVARKIAGTTNIFPEVPDVSASFSSVFTNWYFGTDGQPPAGKFDFVSVVMHELGHGLGFVGSGTVNGGVGQLGYSAGPAGVLPVIYDRTVVNGGGQSLLNGTLFPNPSAALAGQITGNSLFWNGAQGISAAGNVRPRLYAPATFNGGSSYSHLDEATYLPGNANSLMTPQIGFAEAIHNPGAITLGIFADIGWGASAGPTPTPSPTPTATPVPTPRPGSNDLFGAAIEITVPYTRTQSTVGFTTEAGDPNLSGCASDTRPQQSASAWWRYQGSLNGFLTAATAGSDYDTVLAVHRGTAMNNLVRVACNDDLPNNGGITSRVADVPVQAGQIYHIEVTAFGTSLPGNLVLNITVNLSANAPIPDANGDGAATSVDALCVLRQVGGFGGNAICPNPLPLGDVNFSGAVDPVDALCVLRFTGGFTRNANCPYDPPAAVGSSNRAAGAAPATPKPGAAGR